MAEPRRTRPSTFQCAAATLLALVVVVVIVVLLWLFLHPSKLHLSVDHAATAGFNFTTAGALTGAFDLTLRAYNWDERAAVLYRSLDVGVWYNGTYLAGAQAPGFIQPPENETRIDVAAQAAATEVLPRDVEAGMKRERTEGKLTVDVHVWAKVRFRYGVVRTRRYTVRASCPAVVVDFASPTSFDRVYCHIHI
ncbi:NDR1/HIN1-like protein 13 [Phragmites australis]|uniref:NDR1/HIN1-like protein 13 n=1 Tax=Phragmites australis TaxID=29695 RepID=UPI002D79E813|nr:NDR1/HIN1-like protein 13 [Phragmites australis]